MIDLIQFFGDGLADAPQHEFGPVSYMRFESIRSIRVGPFNDQAKPIQFGVVVDGLFYAFKDRDLAVKAARKLADLVSEAVELQDGGRASLYANKAAKAMGETIQEIEDK
ncbi:hypothetical protein LCGC14_0787910 [marine sediment metagenome]|uniref:Uncharacterized protein n=1 Tax=marine sediment metagenome TaxID=412755 RepID=A0A0F9SDB9_9ZZZZ